MIRYAEMVLPGHPDKFCDYAAEAIVEACHAIDDDAYCQVEMAIWQRRVFLTGGLCTRRPLPQTPEQLVRETARRIGYRKGHPDHHAALQIDSHVCVEVGDPSQWSRFANDQCIAVGYAGYDEKVDFLPPEHWLARQFHDALWEACRQGALEHCGPDGKLLLTLRESTDRWDLEEILVSLVHPHALAIDELAARLEAVLGSHYRKLAYRDRRWAAAWEDVKLLVNPNGPWHDGGSVDDNGQTGRKLAMDHYGTRVPIGGGALFGKHRQHIDRVAAKQLRKRALAMHSFGSSQESIVLDRWVPGQPLDEGNSVRNEKRDEMPTEDVLA
ncbi:MAG: methionine adenosyltransferase domain-containing protein [Pseudohaliea sp.]